MISFVLTGNMSIPHLRIHGTRHLYYNYKMRIDNQADAVV